MSTINTGGPAFPLADSCCEYGNTNRSDANGMTLRDYMAIHASDEDVNAQISQLRDQFVLLPDGWRVTARYMHADAMLKAREGGAA